MFATVLVGVYLALIGAWLALAAGVPLMGLLLVTLRGDYYNGDRLLVEIERLLKASPRPPKKPTPPVKK